MSYLAINFAKFISINWFLQLLPFWICDAKVCQIQLNCVFILTNANVLQHVSNVDHSPKRNFSSHTHPPQTLFQLIILDLYSNLGTFNTNKNRTIAFLPLRISFYWNMFILLSGQWTLNSSRRSEKKIEQKEKERRHQQHPPQNIQPRRWSICLSFDHIKCSFFFIMYPHDGEWTATPLLKRTFNPTFRFRFGQCTTKHHSSERKNIPAYSSD